MKLHLITIGQPKLAYAKLGWQEYWQRLERLQQMRLTAIADKNNDAAHLLTAAGTSYKVALVIDGPQLSSPALAQQLDKWALLAREVSFLIGGPEGLPAEVIAAADFSWGLSALTFPHDLAMVVTLEALYRSSTIRAGLPYHK